MREARQSLYRPGQKERNLSAGSGRCIKSCRMEGSEHRALHPFRKQRNFRQYERGIELAAGDSGRSAGSRRSADCECALGDGGLSGKRKKRGKQKLVLFSDEDKCDGAASRFYEPNFKPDFDGELLLTNNYICHFTVIETAFLKELKLRSGFDGAQDYDLVLRAYAAADSLCMCRRCCTTGAAMKRLRRRTRRASAMLTRRGQRAAGRLLSSKRLEGDSERAETSWLLSGRL